MLIGSMRIKKWSFADAQALGFVFECSTRSKNDHLRAPKFEEKEGHGSLIPSDTDKLGHRDKVAITNLQVDLLWANRLMAP